MFFKKTGLQPAAVAQPESPSDDERHSEPPQIKRLERVKQNLYALATIAPCFSSILSLKEKAKRRWKHAVSLFELWSIFLSHVRLQLFASLAGRVLDRLPFACRPKKLLERYRTAKDKQASTPLYKSRVVALTRCSVHILPLLGDCTIVALNFPGYFIGNDYAGKTTESSQGFSSFGLQLTAKIFELLVTASLGKVLFDQVQRGLVSPEGVRFGLSVAHLKFTDVGYFWSREYWYARGNSLLALYALVCGVVALLIQPSAALLLVPTRTKNWKAGGGSIWMAGNESMIWPEVLTLEAAGGSKCSSPSLERMNLMYLNDSGCAWAGYSRLSQFAKEAHLTSEVQNVTILDGPVSRSHTIPRSYIPNLVADTWAMGTTAAVGINAVKAAGRWYDAIYSAPIVQGTPSTSIKRIKYQERSSAYMTIAAKFPVARVSCNYREEKISLNGLGVTQYPYMSLYGLSSRRHMYNTTRSSAYPLKKDTISAFWGEIPDVPLLSNGTVVDIVPTGFLRIQLPSSNTSMKGYVYACSIDARWAVGDSIMSHVYDLDQFPYSYPDLSRTQRSKSAAIRNSNWFPPPLDGSWPLISMAPGWREVAMPAFDKQGTTSLTQILVDGGYDNKIKMINGYGSVQKQLERVIALYFVDAISRVGYSANGGAPFRFSDAYARGETPAGSGPDKDAILKGTVQLDWGYGRSPRNTTKVDFAMSVGGLVIQADSSTKYLAAVVVLVHAAIALYAIVDSLWFQVSSDSWNSLLELLTLAFLSPPPKGTPLNGSTVTIRKGDAYGMPIAVRGRPALADFGHEPLLLVAGDQVENELYDGLKPGVAY